MWFSGKTVRSNYLSRIDRLDPRAVILAAYNRADHCTLAGVKAGSVKGIAVTIS